MTALRIRQIAVICALIAGLVLPVSVLGTEAIEVPADKAQVPAEKPKDPNVKPSNQDKEVDVTIPDDAMPNLDLTTKDRKPDSAEPTSPDEEPASVADAPPPNVLRDLSKLPEPVRRTRALLIEVAKEGDVEKLRALLGVGDAATTLSIGGLDGDPIKFLKEASGDSEGYEILAILLEVLEAGFVHIDDGTEEEMYVWPYFFAWPLDKLSPQQKIELFRILTAGDVQDSNEFGAYIFYRVGIKPNGQWSFFVAGD